MARILAVIVAYHPNKAIIDNITSLLPQVDHVMIVDNDTTTASQQIIASLSERSVSSIRNNENNGVAKGFNQGIRWGLENGYDYFLLLDQDSRVEPQMVSILMEAHQTYIKINDIVLVGPRHEDFDRKLNVHDTSSVQQVPLLITSGSLLSRDLIQKVGLYDERLFIDHVDHDYCLRVAQKGGLSLQVNSAVLLHRFGEAKIKTVFGKSFFLQEYSPFRRYYMMRNRIILYKRFGMFRGKWFWMDLRSGVKDLIKLVLFEAEKGPKLQAVLCGFWDGIRWQEKH